MNTLMQATYLLCFASSYTVLLANVPLNAEGEMTWQYRLMAMAVGGISSLFALHFSKPKSHQEALVRFGAGCMVAFTMTGTVLSLMHVTISIDTVMAAGLVWGSVGWALLGGIVAWGDAGGPLKWLARLVQGDKNINFTKEQLDKLNTPAVVKEVEPTKE